MKRIYVNEKWCLGCHLCEYYCAFANSGRDDMAKALKDIDLIPRIQVNELGGVSFAASRRHYEKPLCVKGRITGALTIEDGVSRIDRDRCAGCCTCIFCRPYGCVIREQTPRRDIDFRLIKERPQLTAFSKKERAELPGGAVQ
ncbi:hypothetical protein [Candidatus Soleaferrea massiliensis]|uniref:hypothetical protein n=1 Tax=Candidatus Soleaferrea massiliensis TaxID=1470354 RepID=UPI000693A165|nr:hypothetical protein [Candidatus Soleaferrea massiliensis]